MGINLTVGCQRCQNCLERCIRAPVAVWHRRSLALEYTENKILPDQRAWTAADGERDAQELVSLRVPPD